MTAPLNHLAFFEALAEDADQSSPAWLETAAGLLVLRLYDAWIRHGSDSGLESLRVAAVRAQVEALDESSAVRSVLLALVDEMVASPRRPDAVRLRLHTYARRLQGDARWLLAADVFRTYVETREPQDVSVEAQEAAFQTGYCYRLAGHLEEAETAYDVAAAIATASRDTFGMLRARIVQAKLAIHRGNLPLAEAELDAVIADAQAQHCERGLGMALAERMAVAGQRGQFEEAAVYGYRALRLCTDDVAREGILSDIATALGEAGHRQAARDAHQVLAGVARDPRIRLLAQVNLLDLSVAEGDESAFTRHEQALAEAPLPVVLRAQYHLIVGNGRRRFGDVAGATRAYEQALAVAEEHQVNEVVLKAEAALHQLHRKAAATHAGVRSVEVDELTITDVIHAMRELRASAMAGA